MSDAKNTSSEPELVVTRTRNALGGKRGVVVTILLNRPTALNALTLPMVSQLADELDALARDEEVMRDGCVVVLTGAGRAFTAGVDLTMAAQAFNGDSPTAKNPKMDLVRVLREFPYAVIGAINGACYTGGFELALACDILVASEHAQFCDTHAKFGIAPSWGLSQKLQRLIGVHRALEVSLTAQPLDAATAERWGIVNRVVPHAELLPTCLRMASHILANQQPLVRHYKRLIHDGALTSQKKGSQMERDRALEYYASMTPDQFAAMKAFLSGRREKKGADTAAATAPRSKL